MRKVIVADPDPSKPDPQLLTVQTMFTSDKNNNIYLPDNVLRQELAEVAGLNLQTIGERRQLRPVHLPPVDTPGLGRVAVLGDGGGHDGVRLLAAVQLQLNHRLSLTASSSIVDQRQHVRLYIQCNLWSTEQTHMNSLSFLEKNMFITSYVPVHYRYFKIILTNFSDSSPDRIYSVSRYLFLFFIVFHIQV